MLRFEKLLYRFRKVGQLHVPLNKGCKPLW